MIGIEAIGVYIPAGRIDNSRRMAKFDVEEAFLRDKVGMLRLAVKASEEETSDLCCRAFADLQQKTALLPDEVECVVVCTQNPDARGLPHTSSIVHAKLGLPEHCAVFDISLGCSGFVYGLSVIQAFMEANALRKGVLLTADPYSKIIDEEDKNTCLLFGDAATATLISDTPVWCTGKFRFGSNGREGGAIQVNPANGKLSMNGRAVFSFSATVVPKNIGEMLAANQLTIDDIDYFIFHQGSRYIVETLRKKLEISSEKVPFMAEDYGNTISSSIPIMLSGLKRDFQRVVVAGFGVGLSWASTVLFKSMGDGK